MGLPISGAWSRKYQLTAPYVDARKWGTGVNPVHAVRGDPGRPYNAKLTANDMGFRSSAEFAVSDDFLELEPPWGYQQDDLAGLDVFADPSIAVYGIDFHPNGWPEWEGGPETGQSTPVNRAEIPSYAARPLGASGKFRNYIRSLRGGAADEDREVSAQVPMETVSEGWINKAASGMGEGQVPDDLVLTSDPAQYERTTSFQQRHQKLVNDRAVMRGTDESRTPVESRIAPMKLKVYSGGQRHYDMSPYQIDDMPRPFYYRTAGTGPLSYMLPNDQHQKNAIQRTPPPDPSMGTPDTELSDTGYGYVQEDTGYY